MKIIGHRGARGLAPENTLKSIAKALEHGVDEVEIDARVTADNVVVLHHDKDLTDGSGNRLRIKNTTYAELLRHKNDLTKLEEAVVLISKKRPTHIEVKPGEPASAIVKIIRKFIKKGWSPTNFVVASYNQNILLEIHQALPEITTVVVERWSSLKAINRAKQLDTKRLSMNQLWLWSYFIKSMSKSGWKLSAYTLNDPAKAKRWSKIGLYGAITDYPDLFDK